MRNFLLIGLLGIALLTLSACDRYDSSEDEKDDEKQTEMVEITIEELAMYDGTEGNPAYIAVDGVVYDVTGVSAWSSGSHNGGMVGTDVSSLIGSAPHGDRVLDDLDVVGNIVD